MRARTRKKRSSAAASVVPTHLWLPCAHAEGYEGQLLSLGLVAIDIDDPGACQESTAIAPACMQLVAFHVWCGGTGEQEGAPA